MQIFRIDIRCGKLEHQDFGNNEEDFLYLIFFSYKKLDMIVKSEIN